MELKSRVQTVQSFSRFELPELVEQETQELLQRLGNQDVLEKMSEWNNSSLPVVFVRSSSFHHPS